MTPTLLQQLYGIGHKRAVMFAPHLTAAMALGQCTTRQRAAHFLAQVGHESGRLIYTKEIWGPTRQQSRYEGRKDLGNTQPGDGKRYMGRGLIQTTGRANHAMTTVRLREFFPDCPDFEADPKRLEEVQWACLSAGLYWRVKNLNKWADAGDIMTITKRVNGAYNGLADRQALLTRALIIL